MSITATTIILDHPIKVGEQEITSVEVRKPNTGALRGLALADILQMDVLATTKLLPRISSLTDVEIAQLDPADLTQLASAVTGFFLPKSVQA